MSVRAYAGIGSRRTPADVLELMSAIAYRLAPSWNLRSGGAEGADSAFAAGHSEASASGLELYLPWPGFNGHENGAPGVVRWEPQEEAYLIAMQYHPAWTKLTRGGMALHARNVHQVLGEDVREPNLSRFIMCWTRNASGSGGTGQALRIAKHHSIPVYDLADAACRRRVERWMETEDQP